MFAHIHTHVHTGGTNGASNTYASGFSYLDKLCLAANFNISVVARQDLWGGNYGLLDNQNNSNPLPGMH
jgi:hypothetical protein